MSSNRPGREKAAHHEAQAREYRRLADSLLTRENAPEAAGELLYAAAKQCINAVANQRGVNPASTLSKREFLIGMGETEPEAATLLRDWDTVTKLHIHADQIYLPPADYTDAWQTAQIFIRQMLEIYAGGG